MAATNWGGGLIAGGIGVNAGFSSNNLMNDAVVTLDGSTTVGSLGFGDTTPSHNWFLNTGSNGQLNLDVLAGVPAINVFNQTATIAVVLAGNKGLAKNGTGILVLSGNNTYTGGTLLNEGLLQINHSNALQGPVTVADGTKLGGEKVRRVLTNDPGMGVIRHVDAGYDIAESVADERGVRVPMREGDSA
jgi:autotransporter-associated beta strand protein